MSTKTTLIIVFLSVSILTLLGVFAMPEETYERPTDGKLFDYYMSNPIEPGKYYGDVTKFDSYEFKRQDSIKRIVDSLKRDIEKRDSIIQQRVNQSFEQLFDKDIKLPSHKNKVKDEEENNDIVQIEDNFKEEFIKAMNIGKSSIEPHIDIPSSCAREQVSIPSTTTINVQDMGGGLTSITVK